MTTRIQPPKKGSRGLIAAVAVLAVLLIGLVLYIVADKVTSDDRSQSAPLGTTSVKPTTTTVSATTTAITSSRQTTPVSTPTTTTRTSETTKPKPAPSGAAGLDEMFNGVYLPATQQNWEEWREMSNDFRKVYINTVTCGSSAYKANCPGFVFLDLSAAPRGGVSVEDLVPYDLNPDDRVAQGKTRAGTPGCWWNQINDNAYYGTPTALSPKVIYGGTALVHSWQPGCGFEDKQHSWRSSIRQFLVYDIGASSSPDPAAGLEKVLSGMFLD